MTAGPLEWPHDATLMSCGVDGHHAGHGEDAPCAEVQ